KNDVMSEFAGSEVLSYGPTYAKVKDSYVSDSGKFTYDVTHTEFPQTDENRTYYTLDINFNDTITFDNFKKDFDIFYFDGRYVTFKNTSYLDQNNTPVKGEVSSDTTYHTLGSEAPYMGFYNITSNTFGSKYFGCNFSLFVKDSAITVDGKKQDIPFAFREYGNSEKTEGSLTLDTENITFKAGDSIKIDLILLPWGTGEETDDVNVLNVREDSILNPLVALNGEMDGYVPTVKAENNEAVITVKGGRNNNAVKATGFTSMKQPKVYVMADNGWQEYNLSSVWGYDGYMINTEKDGTYSISFVYNAENPDKEYTFKIVN
ncbi:MAG: hypothetical protein MJ120_06395, partial [Clostridia bacterium]|nr:hypothetical protein [Clostridia bacterium]